MPIQLRDAPVVGLIDQQTNTWDPHILSDIFIPEDVSRILKIPVSPDYEDSWYWLGDPRGVYSVKNAYRKLVGDYAYAPGAFDKWATIWKLRVPPKWKTGLWRAICDILPTTNNLILKRVEVEPTCNMCGLAHENIMHALILCNYSRLVWDVTCLPIMNVVTDSFPSWIMGVLTVLTEEQFCLVLAVLYHLWKTRNTVVWEHSLLHPTTVRRHAVAALHAYGQSHPTAPGRNLTATPPTPSHARPRCFIDASFKPMTGEATYRAVLLAADGTFIAATNGSLPVCFSPLMAEAAACKEALSWLRERNVMMVDLLTDCSELRSILHHTSSAILSYAGVMIDRCRLSMALFTYCSISFISR
ncbi:PREDICTED: uncharacterized protein LOC109154731 [Ipomoea nil]|uniref:uncharacterized protein LOC109154731 n=1 Tax=Ipomoea nil TaxID=35883 RepID=UPI000901B2BB|nr:PREDICTED: uncharacterized protein LOC109154731 [Ipomoea nil]